MKRFLLVICVVTIIGGLAREMLIARAGTGQEYSNYACTNVDNCNGVQATGECGIDGKVNCNGGDIAVNIYACLTKTGSNCTSGPDDPTETCLGKCANLGAAGCSFTLYGCASSLAQ